MNIRELQDVKIKGCKVEQYNKNFCYIKVMEEVPTEDFNRCIEQVSKNLNIPKRQVKQIVEKNYSLIEEKMKKINYLLELPSEIFINIILNMSAKEIETLCSLSKEMKEQCGQRVWYELLVRDFDYRENPKEGINYKRMYKNLYKELNFEKRIACSIKSKEIVPSYAFIRNGSVYIRGSIFKSPTFFKKAEGFQNAKQVYLGGNAVAVVTKDNALDVFGTGQIKKGGWIDRTFSQRIKNSGVTRAKVHTTFISFITIEGELYKIHKRGRYEAWTDPILEKDLPPIREYFLGLRFSLAITKDDRVAIWKDNPARKKKIYYIPNLTNVRQLCFKKTSISNLVVYALVKDGIEYIGIEIKDLGEIDFAMKHIRKTKMQGIKQFSCEGNTIKILKDGKILGRTGLQFKDLDIKEFQICPIFVTENKYSLIFITENKFYLSDSEGLTEIPL